ncbi:hypothetical protein CQW23_15936 [Capsicum baccatum]|uniref:Yippee domain-containing protein n=1 Tax=Capsicum baccatum TaxID=33114 RepID=A0A2G2WNG7_CAPBA|nr:hypothetical protein CQW23_15936 [Capsicum baccatum]
MYMTKLSVYQIFHPIHYLINSSILILNIFVRNLCGVVGDDELLERTSLFAPEYLELECSSRSRVFLSDSATLLPPFEVLALDFVPFGVEDPKTEVGVDDTGSVCCPRKLALLLVTACHDSNQGLAVTSISNHGGPKHPYLSDNHAHNSYDQRYRHTRLTSHQYHIHICIIRLNIYIRMEENFPVDPQGIDRRDYIYCSSCNNPVAFVEDFIPNRDDFVWGGHFNRMRNVKILPMIDQLHGNTQSVRLVTCCMQCNEWLGWKRTVDTQPSQYLIGRFSVRMDRLMFQNRVMLSDYLFGDIIAQAPHNQVGGANVQAPNNPVGGANANQDGGANNQVGGANAQALNEHDADQVVPANADDGGANNQFGGANAQAPNEQNADQVVPDNAVQDGGANDQVGGANELDPNEQNADQVVGADADQDGGASDQDGGVNEQVPNEQDGGANDQDGGLNEQVLNEQDGGPNDQVGGINEQDPNEQDGGANEQNADQDADANERNHDQDVSVPEKRRKM